MVLTRIELLTGISWHSVPINLEIIHLILYLRFELFQKPTR